MATVPPPRRPYTPSLLTREKDPLLQRGSKKIAEHDANKDLALASKGQVSVQASILGIVPVFVFITDVLAVYFLFYHHQLWCIILIFSTIVGAIVFLVIADKKKAWLHWLGLLCLLASVFATVVGLYNHYRFMIYYYTYGDMRKYTNVAGSQLSTQFGDAGMVLWTADTKIDSSRAVGYKYAEDGGTVYCVAPIMDGTMGLSDGVSFWAVGTNCCEPRQGFACDDAGKSDARSALFLLEPEILVPPSLQWIIEGLSTSEGYMKAIELDKAAFSTVPAKTTTLVRWARDPVKMSDEWRQHGIHFVVWFVAVHAVVSLVLGRIIAMAIQPKRKSVDM